MIYDRYGNSISEGDTVAVSLRLKNSTHIRQGTVLKINKRISFSNCLKSAKMHIQWDIPKIYYHCDEGPAQSIIMYDARKIIKL